MTGNAFRTGKAGRDGSGRGTGGNIDEGVDALGEEVLNLTDLGGGISLGVDGDDLNSKTARITFHAQFDLVEEVRLQVRNGKTDLLDPDILCRGSAGR